MLNSVLRRLMIIDYDFVDRRPLQTTVNTDDNHTAFNRVQDGCVIFVNRRQNNPVH